MIKRGKKTRTKRRTKQSVIGERVKEFSLVERAQYTHTRARASVQQQCWFVFQLALCASFVTSGNYLAASSRCF